MNDYITPKQAVEQLDISAETLKKYSLLLEKNGMDVHRNKRGHRQYSDENLKLIKALIFLNKEKSVNLDEAAALVTSSDFNFSVMNVTHNSVITERSNDITVQNELSVTVTKQLYALQIELEERKHAELAFHELVASKFDEQNQILIDQQKKIEELTELLMKEKNKTFWQRLFGK